MEQYPSTTLASATFDGQTFLVMASTDSVTVVRTLVHGSLAIVDHVIVSRETWSGSVSALEIVSHAGTVYVIVGGADDGITVLQMLPDGQLMTRATIPYTNAIILENVITIAARVAGD